MAGGKETNCPLCGRHCSADAPSCQRGKEYFRTDGASETGHTRHGCGTHCHGRHKHHHRDPVFSRMSIRNYTDQPVEAEKIDRILRAGMAAPSAGNQQPWEFFVVTDKKKIKELSGVSEYSVCAAEASVVIVPCYRTEGLRFPVFDTIDLACATENMLIEAAALGLGSVWLSVAPIEERIKKADEVLGIGDDLHAFVILPIGYPMKERDPQDRFDEDRIHYL